MTTETSASREERIAAEIIATRMARVETCEWATPAVMEVLAEYAADLRDSIPFFVGLDRIRRAVEADRQARKRPDAEGIRLAS